MLEIKFKGNKAEDIGWATVFAVIAIGFTVLLTSWVPTRIVFAIAIGVYIWSKSMGIKGI